jgi:hypothetical protein
MEIEKKPKKAHRPNGNGKARKRDDDDADDDKVKDHKMTKERLKEIKNPDQNMFFIYH